MSAPTHEAGDVPAGPVWLGITLTLLAILLGTAASLFLLVRGRGGARAASRAGWYREVPREVQAVELKPFSSPMDGELEQRAAREHLRSYGWVDRRAGLVHVPIEVAFELYLARREQTP
jgi:hypothetical protein